jgi:hypothetical protein
MATENDGECEGLGLETKLGQVAIIPKGAHLAIIRDATNHSLREGNELPMVLASIFWRGMRVRIRFRCNCTDAGCTRELKLEGAWTGRHQQSSK